MAQSATAQPAGAQPAVAQSTIAQPAIERGRWIWPLVRLALVIAAGLAAWLIANNWDRWTGALRYIRTDDAYMTGNLTPLSAKVSGYVRRVAIDDYQTVHRGDLLLEIEPSDYEAALSQAKANLDATEANLANNAVQKDVQQALIRQAQATIQATAADVLRYHLESQRQHSLLATRLAGTEQTVEQADDNEKRSAAQLALNNAQLDQQKAILESLNVQQKQLAAQVEAARAQLALAQNNLGYTRIVSPQDGMVGQKQVRQGQFVNVGTQVIAVMPLPDIWVIANYKETQMTNVRIGQPVQVRVDAFPDLHLHGKVDSWSPGTGSTFALLPADNATGNFTKVVQRVPVKVVLDRDPALGTLVRPGMSVEASIDTGAEPAGAPTPGTTQRATASR